MMAGLSARAAENPLAWFRKTHTAESLFNLTNNDRMVASPFSTNTMAFMDVDMAAALIITSNQNSGGKAFEGLLMQILINLR